MAAHAMNRDQALARAIETLGAPEFPGALSAFAATLAAFDNLILIAYHAEQKPVVLHREYTDPVVYSPMDSQYVEGAYLLDPFYQEHLRGAGRGLKRLIDVAPDHFRRTEYYNVYYQQTTLIDELAIFANLGPRTTITACFGRDRSSGRRFSKREVRAMAEHQQVLGTLIERHWQDYRPEPAESAHTLSPGERLRHALEAETGIRLSPRQAEVAMLILRGHSSLSIGLHLDISRETVKVFRRQLYAKCNISSQAELFSMMMPLFARVSGGP